MDSREDGLTVIELMISMMILLIIMTPLATSFVLGLGATRASEQDAANSADAQLLASFFDVDVASAETVSTTSGCGGLASILELRWSDGPVKQFVAYRAVVDASRQDELGLTSTVYDLERVVCSTANGPIDSSQTIARTLSAVPVVTCDNGAPCSATPRRVTLRALAHSTQVPDLGSTDTFTFGITASRRVRP